MLRTSIVIPTKNNEATIKQCLDSLMPYFKDGYITDIIIVDGNSTDGTLTISSDYAVTVLSDEGKGFNVACDLGWRNAKGEIIIFFDADAYLDTGYFPEILNFFEDDNVGVVGCHAKAPETNGFTRAIGQEWKWNTPFSGNTASWFRKLYSKIAAGSADVPPGGPCQVIRRTCLETVNGFSMLKVRGGEDIQLARSIIESGWKSRWWTESPVYHHPRTSLRELIVEFKRFGREGYYRDSFDKSSTIAKLVKAVTSIAIRLASPAIGLFLAFRFLNPLHLVIYPIPRYAWIVGYLEESFRSKK